MGHNHMIRLRRSVVISGCCGQRRDCGGERMKAAGNGLGASVRHKSRQRMSAFALGVAALVVAAMAFFAVGVDPAEALPSYARQTGKECAACHTAFPELTPYGRRFKIGGYTDGGGSWQGPPIS